MSYYMPIAIIVISNIFYHVCTKSTPAGLDPFASLTVTYLVGALVSGILFFAFNHGGSLIAEYRNMNWSPWILGIAIVGLEAGTIWMYRVGWNISIGQLVHSAILAICLVIIGIIFYKEQLTASKIAGILICMVGLFFINK